MLHKKLSLIVIVLTLISCTPSTELTITGEEPVPTQTETKSSIPTQQEEVDSLDVGLVAQIDVAEYLSVGEEVRIIFTLTNTSDTPLYILKWYTPLEGIAGEIFQVTRDGRKVPYKGILAYRDAPSPEDYFLLHPDESVEAYGHFGPSYDFSIPGNYEIKFLSPRISHVAYTEEEFAGSLDELGPVQIPSNTVTLEIGDQ